MKKICVVTAARSEYGLLKWLIHDIDTSPDFQLQLVVTGGHLSYEQGHTIDQIIEDGIPISYIADADLDTTTTASIAKSMGKLGQVFADAFRKLTPDYLIILGDRYELLPICSTAFVMNIPIIHLSGGDVTEGAIDNGIRNAITMLADYHFPGTENSAKNIKRMRDSDKNVWTVGEPGLDSFFRENLLNRKELAHNLELESHKNWALMTYHAETRKSLEYNIEAVKFCIDTLIAQTNLQTIITYANADFGGKQINEYIETEGRKYPNQLKIIPSLGHLRYLSYMRQVKFIIGNSSSGIVEAPFLNIPVINIGNRQKGRYMCSNIIQCSPQPEDIKNAINLVFDTSRKTGTDLQYWGDGNTSKKIIQILTKVLGE